jgi:hypothetical protein
MHYITPIIALAILLTGCTSQAVIPSPSTTTYQSSRNEAATTVTSNSDATGDCLIKGNISSAQERIYHIPGCKSYLKTRIDTSAGERWFCTEDEATASGWRKARNCN